jgi:sarcosine/dimethylglycine N-methyltransferase
LTALVTSDPALSYYDGPELTSKVFEALRQARRPVDRLDPDDLAALDEFHALGRPATLALAELAAIRPGERVLDVGAGIGGPSRVLAGRYGAQVTARCPSRSSCRTSRRGWPVWRATSKATASTWCRDS